MTKQKVEALMKRCQIGVGGRDALERAHSIMADCYGTLGALQIQVDGLRAFAKACLDDWPDVGMDGFELQDAAVKAGLLEGVVVHEPCGETCQCVEYHGGAMEMSEGVTCYRKTQLLRGDECAR